MSGLDLIVMVKSSSKSERSIDYPLTKIRLSIVGQGFECTYILIYRLRMVSRLTVAPFYGSLDGF